MESRINMMEDIESGLEDWKGWECSCERHKDKAVNMRYSNLAFSDVKHKKQSCRTCRTSVT